MHGRGGEGRVSCWGEGWMYRSGKGTAGSIGRELWGGYGEGSRRELWGGEKNCRE